MSEHIDEGALDKKAEQKADMYFAKYKDQVQALESSPLAKVRTITPYDVYALGSQLQAYENYQEMCEEDGTLAALGKIPNIALDVVTVAYGSSPLSMIASTQPIDEEQGTVYYKNVIAQTTRGSHTAGDTVFDPTTGGLTPLDGYAADTLLESLGDTSDTVLQYTGNLTNVPLRPYKVTVEIVSLGLSATDNGDGVLIGYNIQGSIDYNTGAYVIDLANNPGASQAISATSATNFEQAPDIPKIIFKLTTKPVSARIWALKDTIGLEQSYAMRKRFGMVAEDEITNDLVAAINSEIMTAAIRNLNQYAVGSVNYTKAAPANVSDFDHRQSFKFKLADAEAVLVGQAGRGHISVLICGLNGASIISTLPGFNKISEGNDIGPHIYGTLDGMTVIRVQNANILDANTILCLYKGTSPFDAAMVWAPYMPLVVTNALPTGTNPLTTQKAAAVWGGLDMLVTKFCTKLLLV